MAALLILSFFVNTILGFIEFLIGIRIVFKIIGARTEAPFVTWVYRASHSFLIPFQGIFPSLNLGSSIVELSTITAFLVYALVTIIFNQILSYTNKQLGKEEKKD